jgi:hypothetical protein
VSRRRLLAAAGGVAAGLAGLAGLAGCGSSASPTPTNPEFNGADADVLDGLLGVGNRAVAAYARAAAVLGGAPRALVRRIGVQEAAHVYALTGAVDRLGGMPTPAPRAYAFTVRDASEALALVAETEEMSIAAAIDALAKVTDHQARGTVVSIANNDAQHAMLIAQARGLPPLGAAIVRGRA